MSFAVRLLTVESVADHPNADRLSICTVLGYECVTAKRPDGSHAFRPGQQVIYVPEGAVLTDDQLKQHGFWKDGRGTLAGAEGNRVKPVELRKRLSTGLIWPLEDRFAGLPENSDVTEILGIVKYVPPVPAELLEVAVPLLDAKTSYDIARLRMYPNLLANDEVIITEKLEGECLQATWLAGQRIDGLFGGGHIAITTKGLGEKGLVFMDNEKARKVPVVRAALASGIIEKLARLAQTIGADHKVRLFSEAVGPGVKKLHYAGSAPFARSFDIRVDERWLDESEKASLFENHDLERVPVLYRGRFDPEVVEQLREGDTTIGGQHIREGVVVTAVGSQEKRVTELGDTMRPILKAHSDRFLKKFSHED